MDFSNEFIRGFGNALPFLIFAILIAAAITYLKSKI